MILSTEQIREIMKAPRNKDALATGGTLQDKHKLHITGEGYQEEIKRVEGFESGDEFNIRKQIAQPATIQITKIILDNLNRWTTAQGTVKKVNFKNTEKDDDFVKVLNQVWHGDSFNKFINTFYKDAIYTEFNGFILVTKPKIIDNNFIVRDGIIMPRPEGNLDPYLIFIANADIYDFYMTGDTVEYIIIKIDDYIYRLIDDEKDMIFEWRNEKSKIPEAKDEGVIPNEIGYVPARKISSINKRLMSTQVKTSPIDHVIPALDRYFSCDADLRMQFIRHNYPKLAIVAKNCSVCDGEGHTYNEKDTRVTCKTCDGSGKVVPISRGGVIALPQYLEQGDSPYPGTPASYITPETESLRLGLEDLLSQRQNIIYSGTGDKNLVSESLNTATENLINSRSLEDRIRDITMMVEEFETFIKQCIKDLHNDFASIEEYSIIVRYGKRISIRDESELLAEIQESKKAGMPVSYIEALNRDLIYAKYKNDKAELERQLLLSELEPLAGYSLSDINTLKDNIYPRDLQLKLNFDAVIAELEQTQPVTMISEGKPTNQRLAAINLMIDEILQKRFRTRNLNGGQDVQTTETATP